MAQPTWAQTMKLLDTATWSKHPATQTVNFGVNHVINVRSLEFNDVTATINYRDDDKVYVAGKLTYTVPGGTPCINTDIPMHFQDPYKISDDGAADGTLLQPGVFNIADISMTVPQGGIIENSTDEIPILTTDADKTIFDTFVNFPLYISDSSAQYWRINVSLSGTTDKPSSFGVYPVIFLRNTTKYSSVFNSNTPYLMFSFPISPTKSTFSASFTDIVNFGGFNAYLVSGQPHVGTRIAIRACNIYGEVQDFNITSLNVQYTLEPVSRT